MPPQLDSIQNAPPRVYEVWGLSQADSARLFGVSRQAVGKWLEQGVPVDRAEALADLAAATDLLIRVMQRFVSMKIWSPHG